MVSGLYKEESKKNIKANCIASDAQEMRDFKKKR
jgi:hypothetical protein